jgi:7,8-dihydropterin-6-yl-methyl-4-(beta-D-ribofuranosyl)aminobenzene 5'-phosphate synthase
MITRARISVLADNQAADGLVAEHGLSFLIETESARVLFDTGQGTALVPNAARLGIELGGIDHLVLSHGHYDHTGGVLPVLQRSPQISVHLHPAAGRLRYGLVAGEVRPIHMPRSTLTALVSLPSGAIHHVSLAGQIAPGIGVTGFIPRETTFEDTGGPFYLDPEGWRPDPLEDDQALYLDMTAGLVVCVGCGHAGLVNTLRWALRSSGARRIRAVLGGFHLAAASEWRLQQTGAAMRAMAPDIVVPCHCTGERAVTALGYALPDRVSAGAAGSVYEF